MASMFVAFVFMTVKVTSKFLEGKIVLELSRNEVSIKDIPFPAVTICPQIVTGEKLPTFNQTWSAASDDQ
jgi:Amiloride-sensitive sodium channel